MNQPQKILFLIVVSLSLIGCSNKSIQNLHEIEIDAGPFKVTTPSNFKLIKEQGIDSYVGKITNGKIEFSFDYGWYSNRGPLSYYDYADKYLFKIHGEEIVSTCGLTDSIYQMIRANPIILDAQRNSQFPIESDKEISITISVVSGTCTIHVFNMIGEISDNYQTHIITENIDSNLRTKHYHPKTDKNKRAGVFIENLEEKRDEKYGHNKLSFATNDFKEKNSKLILKILNAVKLKTTGKK